MPGCLLLSRFSPGGFSARPAFPYQVQTGQCKHQQSEFQQGWITFRTFPEKMIVQRNFARDQIGKWHSIAQLGTTFRTPPEQTQRESDEAVKCSASQHHSLVMKLADSLVLVGSLQQKCALLQVKNVDGCALCLAYPQVRLWDHPLPFVWAGILLAMPFTQRVDKRLRDQPLVLFFAEDVG